MYQDCTTLVGLPQGAAAHTKEGKIKGVVPIDTTPLYKEKTVN